MEATAPDWAGAIRNRLGIHGQVACPDNIEDAWKWKQFAGLIDSITEEPFEALLQQTYKLTQNLRKVTATLASYKAWFHLLHRTERDLRMKQALQGWKLTVKKIGKGTGKNAPMLRKQARDLMAQCQRAVPAWIMTINKALESLDPSHNIFDVVIVDEASQSDITALAIVYMAKKIIIVGDDKQVSPLAVGMDMDRMNALRDMYIKNIIPNWHLYDAKTSLYDVAGTTFQPLMLREHFRCVPEIIGYSNKLSYDYKIRPLRDASTSKIKPALVSYRVGNGIREEGKKINRAEAESIAALLISCLEQNEYDGMTFGVISLLGNEQALNIQQIIFEKIEPQIIEERKILCGDASHFQGDERDVIFLSMVDSNENEGPLAMSGDGADQSRKQRLNVAASRAKNQMWVIHSLDYTRDLKSGDLRRDLIEYAENPKAFTYIAETIEAKSESPFEEQVAMALVSAGYHISQQWEVGAYRIDMVALYRENRVAIECDGELYHSGEEKIRADMERQTILERLGWRFIRIRGSEFYRNQEKAIVRIIADLESFGIFPETQTELVTNDTTELLNRIKIRATQIINEWVMQDAVGPATSTLETLEGTFEENNNADMADQKENNDDATIIESLQLDSLGANEIPFGSASPHTRVTRITNAAEPPKLTSNVVTRSPNTKTQDKRELFQATSAVIDFLEVENIDFIDKREQSGIIWVLYSNDIKDHLEKMLEEAEIRYSLEKRGSIATKNRAAWRIMTSE